MALSLLDVNDEPSQRIFKNLTVPELAIARGVPSSRHKSNGVEIDERLLDPNNTASAAAKQRNIGDLLSKLRIVFRVNDKEQLAAAMAST